MVPDDELLGCHSLESDRDILIESLKQQRQKHGKNLYIAHINVNSLGEKRDYFRDILSMKLIDILCVTETKLSEDYVHADLHVDGYKIHRKDRSSRSGGILVWIRDDLPHRRDTDYEIPVVDMHVESMVINITVRKEQWYLIVVYKNPNVANNLFVDLLCDVYKNLLSNGTVKEVILLGDLNINMIKTPNIMSENVCDIYGLTNLIKSPTCYKSTSGTLLDPIIVINKSRFQKPINIRCGYSDWHNFVCCITKLQMPKVQPKTVRYRSYKNFDENVFANDVSKVPFHVNEIFEDIDDKYWCISTLYREVLNEHAPEKRRVIKTTQVPYMNSTLRKQMYKRSMARNRYTKRRDHATWTAYITERNRTTHMRREAIKSYFVQKCSNMSRPSDFWDCVKPFLSQRSTARNNIILNEDGRVVTNQTEISDIFNKFFAHVASDIGCEDSINTEDSNWLENVMARHQEHPSILAISRNIEDVRQFNFMQVQESTVQQYLKNINAKKATGFDSIPPKTVKLTHKDTAKILANLFNEGFASCKFPEDMKFAEIAPIHKKESDMDKCNFRPVSILTSFSKLYESLITHQLSEYFSVILHDQMCAYRKKYASSHTLISLIESWKKALDNNQCVGTLLMDLSKAFDCVPHGLLLCKLKAYGLSDNACRFMGTYLSGRKQRVKIDGTRSEWHKISKGIPQGSCLGPVIFNVFLNDIFHFIEHCRLANYADDNTLSTSAKHLDVVTAALISDTNNAINWFTSNFMQANPQKFQIMFMTPLNHTDAIPEVTMIKDAAVSTQTHVKLLGITIDSKLTFDMHIENLCKKASQQLNILRRFKNMFKAKELNLVFNSFIMANFNYCPIVWHFCGVKSMKRIEMIQERALRLMYDDLTTPYTTLLQKHEHVAMHVKQLRTIAIEVFKSLNDLNPPFMKEHFEVKTLHHNLRDNFKLSQPKFNTIKYGRNSFTYYGAHLWNLLPNDLKCACNLHDFKTMLQSWDGPKCCCSLCSFKIM